MIGRQREEGGETGWDNLLEWCAECYYNNLFLTPRCPLSHKNLVGRFAANFPHEWRRRKKVRVEY